MSQDTKNNPENLPMVHAKVSGNRVKELEKDEFVWHCNYENILRITNVFIQVEAAASEEDKRLFEKSIKIYLGNQGYKVNSATYYDDARILKEYLKTK